MRIAVVGFGRMGRHHARILRSLGHAVTTVDPFVNAGADVVHIADVREFDRAVIAVPPASLASVAERFQLVGIPTLIEKPCATSLGDLGRLDPLLTRAGYVERFNPALRAMRENLERIGAVRHIEARRLGSVWGDDVITDLATHEFDALRFLGFSPEVESVHTRAGHAALGWQRGQIIASYLYPRKVRKLEVVGAEAMLTLDYQAQTLALDYAGGGEMILDGTRMLEPLREELLGWLGDSPSVADYSDAHAALTFCNATHRDAELESRI